MSPSHSRTPPFSHMLFVRQSLRKYSLCAGKVMGGIGQVVVGAEGGWGWKRG